MSTPLLIIAIDGGAATGKSSTARGVAARLNLLHVDTGSHYRAVTLLALREGAAVNDAAALGRLLASSPLDTRVEGRSSRITLRGVEPKDGDLRSPEVNAAVSHIAAQPVVREALKDYQRGQAEVARSHGFPGVVMEGRDIGSVIFPDAALKIFLEADPGTRALRRATEGQTDSITERDRIDAGRKTAPLMCPAGAVRIDTASLDLEGVIGRVCELAEEVKASTKGTN